ncbi:MAG TPA: LysM peptidoglycan-binding domain-containing protein [Polyangia bacterium]|nr:LysM peptidoglycan-binding domain-containing protein [Polyangia bacterium]
MKSVAVALVVLGISATASAKVVVYSARSGDTPESIAADYYGNRSQAIFILETNGLERDKPLKPGQKVRIPTAFHYRVRKGDTLEGLAKRFLDDGRRAPFLAAFSGLRPTDKLREGQDLLIPFQHVHRTEVPESLQSVARAFYGDASKAKLLADYNFRSAPMLAKGERVLVPIGHVHIRAVKLQPVVERPVGKMKEAPAPVVMVAPPKEAQKREAELAEKVGKSLAIAEKAYKDGSYSDVPAVLDKVLTEEEPSEAQLAELFRLKAFAYVALGLDDLAVNAFREVLARKPDVALDEATVSPKIRAALDRAKKSPGP